MAERPYRFANEYICGRIAHFLLLPCPPFAITFFEGQKGLERKNEALFSSLDFDYERDAAPMADFDACVNCLGDLCAGILAFDIFIANADRVRKNIWCDDTLMPTRLLIFDHDYALFGEEKDGGIGRLLAVQTTLGLSLADSGNDYHPFLSRIRSARALDKWLGRIHSLPKWFIRQVCQDAEKYGIKRSEANAAASFLTLRRNLEPIILANRAAFEKITDWQEGGLR